MTIEDIEQMLWQQLKAKVASGAIPIRGGVYYDRDLANISEDITVKAIAVGGFGNRQRADVNINVFVDDKKKNKNAYIADKERLAELSRCVLDYIAAIDFISEPTGTVSCTQHVYEEPSLHQHYANFLLSIKLYDC